MYVCTNTHYKKSLGHMFKNNDICTYFIWLSIESEYDFNIKQYHNQKGFIKTRHLENRCSKKNDGHRTYIEKKATRKQFRCRSSVGWCRFVSHSKHCLSSNVGGSLRYSPECDDENACARLRSNVDNISMWQALLPSYTTMNSEKIVIHWIMKQWFPYNVSFVN